MRPDAIDLIRWADRLDCRARLPELVRRLLHSTSSDIVEVEFAAGEGVQRPGLDGRVRAGTATAFVPQGLSIWEMGCSQDPQAKANGDYAKRVATMPPAVSPKDTVYVFVTPRRWTGRDQWAADRKAENIWADVRAYDADSLEQWLELSPAACAWLAQQLGRPSDVQAIEDYFSEWSVRTTPATPDTLLLAGREDAQRACLDWIQSTPSALSVSVPDTGEAAAYLYAVLRQVAGSDRQRLLDRAVVVQSNDTLRTMGLEGRGLIIAALGCGLDVARVAARRGHHILCATEGAPAGERIVLGPLDRPRVMAELESMGIDTERAKTLARESNGQTTALRRLLGDVGPAMPSELAPLLLLGGWDEARDADMDVVLKVFGRAAPELQQVVRRHSVGAGAPLRRSGTGCTWQSRLDAWHALSSSLMPGDLQRYRDVAVQVLTVEDPRFELAEEDRWLAAMRGKVLPHSGLLRSGLAETAAILGAEGGTLALADAASEVVYKVLDTARTWQQWATLDDLLPTLAEAAPVVFLREVRKLVEQHDGMVRALRNSSTRSMLSWSDHLNGLVWALETLAWHADYLAEATEILALIAEQEAEASERGDRAMRALREIFLPWMPHTTAAFDERVATVTSIVKRPSGVRFAFLLSLLPQWGGDSSTGTHKPAWRQWLAQWKEGVTRGEVQRTFIAVCEQVISLAERDPARWAAVVPHLHQLSPAKHRPGAIAALGALDVSSLQEADRHGLWVALRRELHRHRSLEEAEWALPESDLAHLEALYLRLTPSDPATRFGWLFAQNPELPDFRGHDWRAEQDALASARSEASRQLWELAGLEGILRVAASEVAYFVGVGVAAGCDEAACRTVVHGSTSETGDWAWRLRAGVAAGLSPEFGAALLARVDADALAPRHRADLCLGMPFTAPVWDLVDSWGEEARAQYWRNAQPWLRENLDGEPSRAVRELIGAGRAADAIDLMGMLLHRFKTESHIKPRDIVDALTAGLSSQGAGRQIGSMDVHHAGELFDVLQSAGAEWEADLTRLEWAWFQAMDHVRDAKLLYRALAENPQFFVQLLSYVFRGENDEPHEPSESESARAQNAFRLLERWHGMPAQRDDGGVDLDALRVWVDEARKLARGSGRGPIADQRIGQVLARAPAGEDGVWPHEAVRDLLEELRDVGNIQQGFVIGRRNQRGGFSKSIGEGGGQERAIAASYREGSEGIRHRWPVAARFLRELAEDFDRDAQQEDVRAVRDKEAYIWAAGNEDRLAAWVDNLQAKGRYTFSVDDAAGAIGRPAEEAKQTCITLVSRTRLASPEDGFFVIVPLEYRSAGCPPADWFIDEWMRWAGARYAVGLLSAAALHGAAHHQPQAFQVLVAEQRPAAVLGRVRVEFVADPQIEHRRVIDVKTETGTMRVLTPEETAQALVEHAEASGGIDAVAGVLAELGERVEPAAVAVVAERSSVPSAQRFGYLLALAGWKPPAEAVQGVLLLRKPCAVWLRSNDVVPEGIDAPEPWLVAVDREVELDQ